MSLALPASPLVSAAWLSAHRHEVVILDCSVARQDGPQGTTLFASGRELFTLQHIPSAQFADLFGDFSAADAPLPFTAPDARAITRALQCLGIHADSAVIVYDQLNGAYAARVWYLLAAVYNVARVRALAGNFNAWRKFSGALEHGAAPRLAQGDIQLAPARPLLVSTLEVEQDSSRLRVCALRSAPFRRAHLPDSVNIPYPALLDGEGHIDVRAVKAALQSLHILPPQALLLYCGGGINAAGLALALVTAGYPLQALSLYDDSMNGWLSDGIRPVERGEGKGIYVATYLPGKEPRLCSH